MEDLTELPGNRAIVLQNITCPYCGISLQSDNDTKEHVIGRRFVPKGSLNGHWNLIVRACTKCNHEKSILEDDISAITLAAKYWFKPLDSDESLLEGIRHKANKSVSKRTRKKVIDSQEKTDLKVDLTSSASLTFDLIAPPQVESERLHELARMQLMAIFYFLTFDKTKKTGGFWRGGFYVLPEAHHADWGNELHKSFMNVVADWKPRWLGNTADGFFRSIIRKHPSEECWSWALEWNKNYRLIGFIGSQAPVEGIVSTLTHSKIVHIDTGANSWVRFRAETQIADEEDCLFA